MSRDRLLGGDEVDAFELGDCDENGVCRSGGRTGVRVTIDAPDTGSGDSRPRFGPLSAHLTTMEDEA